MVQYSLCETAKDFTNFVLVALVDVYELQNNSETMNYKIIPKTRSSTRDYRGLYGITWNYMGLHGIIWDCMGLHGIIWDYIRLHGITGDYMRLHEITWDYRGLHEIT